MTQARIESPYCRTCRRALNALTERDGGPVRYLHGADDTGKLITDHEPDPVPVAELPDPIQLCDFCSEEGATQIYLCDNYARTESKVTKKFYAQHEMRDQGFAARVRRVETGDSLTRNFNPKWSACPTCSDIIEARDLMGLIARVQEIFPARMRTGKRLIKLRGELTATYEHFFATVRPGRLAILPGYPLGVPEIRPKQDQQRPDLRA